MSHLFFYSPCGHGAVILSMKTNALFLYQCDVQAAWGATHTEPFCELTLTGTSWQERFTLSLKRTNNIRTVNLSLPNLSQKSLLHTEHNSNKCSQTMFFQFLPYGHSAKCELIHVWLHYCFIGNKIHLLYGTSHLSFDLIREYFPSPFCVTDYLPFSLLPPFSSSSCPYFNFLVQRSWSQFHLIWAVAATDCWVVLTQCVVNTGYINNVLINMWFTHNTRKLHISSILYWSNPFCFCKIMMMSLF